MYINPELSFLFFKLLIGTVILLITCALNQLLISRIGTSKQPIDRILFFIGCICEFIALVTFLYSLGETVGFYLFK